MFPTSGLECNWVRKHEQRDERVHEQGVLHEVDSKQRNSTCQSSGLLIKVNQKELVDQESHYVEDGASKVDYGHSTRVHQDDKHG